MTPATLSFDTPWRRRDLWLLLGVMLLVGWVRSFPMYLPALPDPDPAPASVSGAEQPSEQLRQRYSLKAQDGTLHPYPFGIDSYGWLRWARNWLEHGNSCDQIVEGECRDLLTLAPWGKELIYGSSLHIPAIAWLHRLMRTLEPDIPLLSSALWLQLLLGVLAVIPAYLLGRLLGGTVGGVTAAVLVSLNPAVLGRTLGVDNDIWSVLLVLAQQWALIAALLSRTYPKALLHVALGAGFSALWAGVWSGWVYGYALAWATLLGHGLVQLVVHRSARQLGRALALLLTYWLLTWAALQLTATQTDYLGLPLALAQHIFESGAAPDPSALNWPNPFITVDELRQPGSLARVAAALGGESFLLVAYLGLLLVCLPARGWRRREPAVLVLGVVAINALGLLHPAAPAVNQAVLTLPLLAALALRLSQGGADAAPPTAAALALVAWCLSTLVLGFSALRFLMLFTLPWGLALGVACGRIYLWLGRELERANGASRRVGVPLMDVVLGVVLGLLALPGIQASWYRLPQLTSVRVEALQALDAQAAPDAIVTDLWDRGYFDTYFGRRAVNSDGGTLRTRVPYWVGRFYAAADDRAAVGVLRMLNCGSAGGPLPEGRKGALQRLEAAGLAPRRALALLNQLLTLDRQGAAAVLSDQGLDAAQQTAVLESTHCRPPESWIIAAPDYLYHFDAWLKLALWDPLLPSNEQAKGASHYYPPRQLPCNEAAPGVLECRLGLALPASPGELLVSIPLDHPHEATILGPQGETLGLPGLVAVMQGGALDYHAAPQPRTNSGIALDLQRLGLLVDSAKGKADSIPPSVLHSTLLRLAYVEGYSSDWFEPVAGFEDAAGVTIKLWRVKRWE